MENPNTEYYKRTKILINQIKNYFPFFLPLLLIFSRSLADITIVIVSILFLYNSHKKLGWEWVKERWFFFSLVFCIYCMTINSVLSINPSESLAYSIFFIRWPIFAMALAYWIFDDKKALKNFLVSMTIVLVFIIFDTWWQFFFEKDIFGLEQRDLSRLTGPFSSPHVGMWLAKLALLPCLFLILIDKNKLHTQNYSLIYSFFLISVILFLTVFISGERMSLLLTVASIIILLTGFVFDKLFSFKKLYVLILISCLSIFIFSYHFPETTQRAFYSTIHKIINWKTSDYGIIWQNAYEIWMQSPFFGTGLHKYREACENLFMHESSYIKSIDFNVCFHPHNISLQLLSETGLFGFLLFYLMVIFLAISSLKKYYIQKQWLYFAINFNIIFSCFLPIASGTSFFSNKYGAIIWLLIGVMLAVNKNFSDKKLI